MKIMNKKVRVIFETVFYTLLTAMSGVAFNSCTKEEDPHICVSASQYFDVRQDNEPTQIIVSSFDMQGNTIGCVTLTEDNRSQSLQVMDGCCIEAHSNEAYYDNGTTQGSVTQFNSTHLWWEGQDTLHVTHFYGQGIHFN